MRKIFCLLIFGFSLNAMYDELPDNKGRKSLVNVISLVPRDRGFSSSEDFRSRSSDVFYPVAKDDNRNCWNRTPQDNNTPNPDSGCIVPDPEEDPKK